MHIISYEKKDHIANIKWNTSEEAFHSLKAALRDVEEDREIYVLVLTGEDLLRAAEVLETEEKAEISVFMEKLRVPVLAASKNKIPDGFMGCDITIVSEHPEEDAGKMAVQIAANAPIAVQQIKRCVNLGLRSTPEIGRAYELQAFSLCHGTQDKTVRMKRLLDNRT